MLIAFVSLPVLMLVAVVVFLSWYFWTGRETR